MDEKITFNNDKTIKFIRCKKCEYPISFVNPITAEELKFVSFDCPNCNETYFLKGDKIVTSNEHNQIIRASLINAFNNRFRKRRIS